MDMKDREILVTPEDELQIVLDRAAGGSVIRFAPGVYRQKLLLRTPGLTLLGAAEGETVLCWDDWARKLDACGRETNTFRTWTLAVCADGVSLRGLTVVNDAGEPARKGQEVALSVCADGFEAEDCVLRSTQDTLFLGPLPPDLIERYEGFLPDALRRPGPLSQRLRRCRIEGSVDFVFGCGEALFEDCELRSVYDGRAGGYVAAPAHTPEQSRGFLFRRCAFTAARGVAPASVYLARPWRDYGLARFEDCAYDAHIAPAGFDPWLDSGRDATARFFETPSVPGRVGWINQASR